MQQVSKQAVGAEQSRAFSYTLLPSPPMPSYKVAHLSQPQIHSTSSIHFSSQTRTHTHTHNMMEKKNSCARYWSEPSLFIKTPCIHPFHFNPFRFNSSHPSPSNRRKNGNFKYASSFLSLFLASIYHDQKAEEEEAEEEAEEEEKACYGYLEIRQTRKCCCFGTDVLRRKMVYG